MFFHTPLLSLSFIPLVVCWILFFVRSSASHQQQQQYSCLASLQHLNVFVLQDVTNSTLITAREVKDHLSYFNDLKHINKNTKLGLATFSDRPYIAPRSSSNGDHCIDVQSKLVSSSSKVQNAVNKIKFSHTRADKSGQLDALLQTATSQFHRHESSESKSKGTLNVLVLSTATLFNQHGQIEELMGNNTETHNDEGCRDGDYPTLKQIRKAFRHSHVSPVFITPTKLQRIYESLLRRLNVGGESIPYSSSSYSNNNYDSENELQQFEASLHHALESICHGLSIPSVKPPVCKRKGCMRECNNSDGDIDDCKQECRESFPPCQSSSITSEKMHKVGLTKRPRTEHREIIAYPSSSISEQEIIVSPERHHGHLKGHHHGHHGHDHNCHHNHNCHNSCNHHHHHCDHECHDHDCHHHHCHNNCCCRRHRSVRVEVQV